MTTDGAEAMAKRYIETGFLASLVLYTQDVANLSTEGMVSAEDACDAVAEKCHANKHERGPCETCNDCWNLRAAIRKLENSDGL